MRCDQFIGLSKAVHKIIKGDDVYKYTDHVRRIFPDGTVEEFENEVYGPNVVHSIGEYTYAGMFQEYKLPMYTFHDGSILQEKEQQTIWSSGPMIFTALVDNNGEWIKESLWTAEEMEQYT